MPLVETQNNLATDVQVRDLQTHRNLSLASSRIDHPHIERFKPTRNFTSTLRARSLRPLRTQS
jgi:hypothetical protein